MNDNFTTDDYLQAIKREQAKRSTAYPKILAKVQKSGADADYPRLIWMDRNRKSPRITKETAAYEVAVWESLTRWFAKEYLGLDELPAKRRKKQ